MKTKGLLVLLAMVLVVSLAAFAACAKEEEVVTEGWQWPDRLMLGTAGIGEQGYVVGIAWTTPMDKAIPEMTVRVVVQPDMLLRYIWLRNGTIDITTIKQSGKPWIRTARENATRDGGPSQMNAFGASGKRDKGWATTPGTGIKTPNDIKPGTRIIYSAYLGPVETHEYALGIIAWAQVDIEDIEWVPSSAKSATHRILMDGRGDMAYAENTAGSMWYEAEAGPRGLSWVNMDYVADPEGAERHAAAHPDVTLAQITNGVPGAIGVYGMTTMGPLLVMEDKDPELIYNIQKWQDENYDLFKDNHPLAAGMTPGNVMILAETHFIPIHEGAVRYLKEMGLWTSAAEERRQDNVDLIDQYIKAWGDALLDADTKGIEVNPKNKEWVDLWFSYRDPIPVLASIRQTYGQYAE